LSVVELIMVHLFAATLLSIVEDVEDVKVRFGKMGSGDVVNDKL
jgi:hypothetical protein